MSRSIARRRFVSLVVLIGLLLVLLAPPALPIGQVADMWAVHSDTGVIRGNGPALSGDGSLVAFSSSYQIDTGATTGKSQIMVQSATGSLVLISRNASGLPANDSSGGDTDISADGTRVVFSSRATDLVTNTDLNAAYDIFVYDIPTDEMRLVSAVGGAAGDGSNSYPTISADGSTIAWESDATNLIAGDTNSTTDIFVYDYDTGIIERISETLSGVGG